MKEIFKNIIVFLAIVSFFGLGISTAEDLDKDTKESMKKFVSSMGNFKSLAKDKKILIAEFNVEYVYKRFAGKGGVDVISRGEETIKLSSETYKKLTDALYDSFVSAVKEYSGKEVLAKTDLANNEIYKSLNGKEYIDTKDAFISAKRAGDVRSSKEHGYESITYGPTDMTVLDELASGFSTNKYAEITGKLDANICMKVKIFVDFDRKKDIPMISKANVDLLTQLNKRQKMVPFKGPVPGEFIYEFYGIGLNKIGLKNPISTDVKVTDRRTGFWAQTSGSFNVDVDKLALSILETYQKVAVLQAIVLSGN